MVRPVDRSEALDGLRTSDIPRLVLWPEDANGPSDRAVGSAAVLSGSFDPLTVAHEAVARAAAGAADAVVLLYSPRTLPKEPGTAGPLLSESERLDVLERFCASRPKVALGLCSHGLLVDQVRAAMGRFPGAELTVVLGSDKLIQLFVPHWYEDRDEALGALFGAAAIRYALRRGDGEAVAALLADAAGAGWTDRIERLDVDPVVAAVAARDVRERARSGAPVDPLVPPEARDGILRAILRERLSGIADRPEPPS